MFFNRNKLSETKGHGKLRKTAVGVVSVLGLSAVLGTQQASVVSADDIADTTTVESDTSSVQDENASVTDTSADTTSETTEVTTPTQSDVDEAQQTAQTADEAVAAQQLVVDEAQAKVDSDQTEVDANTQAVSEAQEVASQATDENIKQATDDVTSAQNTVSTNENAVSESQDTVTSASEAVQAQQEVVNTDTETVASAQESVDAAQADVATAQANLDGTGASTIIQNQATAQANQESAQSAEAQAETALTDAQNADSKLASDIATKTTEVNKKQAELKTASENLTEAQTVATETSAALATAATEKEKANNAVKSINTITLSDAYVKALKGYGATLSKSAYDTLTGTDSTAAERKTARTNYLSTLKDLNSVELTNNSYVSNENDKSVVITDLNNLSEEVRTNLSLFASDLINQIRTQFGTQLTSVTSSSVEASDLVTDGYVADNWGFGKGHDISTIEKASEELGAFSNGIGGISENLNSWSRAYTTLSLDSLKRLVYQSIIAFMLNGSEWLHASSIAGLTNSSEYIGVDISVRTGVTSVHVNDIEDEEVTSSSFSKTAIKNPYNSDTLLAAQKQANATYNSAKSADDTAQSNLTAAQTTYNKTSSELSALQSELTTLQNTALQTPAAQKALEQAKANLATANEELAKANEAVANLNADVQTKTELLNQAKAVLAQKQADLKSAQDQLATDTAKLHELVTAYNTAVADETKAEQTLADSKQALKDAQDYLAKLQNAPKLLAEAQEKLATAQAKLAEDKATLEEEVAKLKELQEEADLAEADYQSVLSAYNAYLAQQAEEQRLANIASDLEEIQANGQQAVPVFDENGVLVGYTPATTSGASTSVTPTAVSAPSSSVSANVKTVSTSTNSTSTNVASDSLATTSNSVLPSTGDSKLDEELAMLGLAVLFGAGAVGYTSKKRKKGLFH